MNGKVSVSVNCLIDRNGMELPRIIYWNDGREFIVERTLHTCIEENSNGEVVRYAVLICGRQRYLYREGQCWYVMT